MKKRNCKKNNNIKTRQTNIIFQRFLYHALSAPSDKALTPREITFQPELSGYIKIFDNENDYGLLTE